jgi:cyclopropane fatty-acyl-phospholipid synthase-like methyltransferase
MPGKTSKKTASEPKSAGTKGVQAAVEKRIPAKKKSSAAKPAAAEGPSFSHRFQAWWYGYDIASRSKGDRPELPNFTARTDVTPIAAGGPDIPREVPPPPLVIVDDRVWPTERIEVAQKVWGQGFVEPGDAAFAVDFVKPFNLNPAMSVLDLSTGLGGPARAIVSQFGVWIAGVDRSPGLVANGTKQSEAAGLAKKATVSIYDPEIVQFKPRIYDCAFGRDLFLTVRNKARFLEMITSTLKSKGQFLFTDVVVPDEATGADKFQAWAAAETVKPAPWKLSELKKALKELTYDVRIAEDMTDKYLELALAGWHKFSAATREAKLGPKHREILSAEINRWAMLCAAYESRQIRLFRFFALKTI